MEQPSVTHSGINYLGQNHKQTDNSVLSSHKEVCKQLDICQVLLHEKHEQKGQEKFNKSSSRVAQQLQKSQRVRNNILRVRKGNKLTFPKTLKR